MIRALLLAALLGAATAFAPAGRAIRSSLSMFDDDRSIALPFDKRPANLDGSLPGDVGFDPAGFSNNPPDFFGGNGFKWYREAEIVHGRVAQLAVVGNIVPAWFHFAGNPDMGVPADAYAALNPYTALSQIPETGYWHILSFIFFLECLRSQRIIRGDKEPGDFGLGQTGFNPFNFNYSPEEYRAKQVQELKHGRLAMFGALGMLLQAKISGLGITEQLAGAFTFPEYASVPAGGMGTLGDYFPPNL